MIRRGRLGYLPLTDETKTALRELAERSAREKNWYRPFSSPGGALPGDEECYTVWAGSFKVVFTYTVHGGQLFRHLTISQDGDLPDIVPALTIAFLLGYTGASPDELGLVHEPGPDWVVAFPLGPTCVAIGQPVNPKGSES